jgi:hypothetical protein
MRVLPSDQGQSQFQYRLRRYLSNIRRGRTRPSTSTLRARESAIDIPLISRMVTILCLKIEALQPQSITSLSRRSISVRRQGSSGVLLIRVIPLQPIFLPLIVHVLTSVSSYDPKPSPSPMHFTSQRPERDGRTILCSAKNINGEMGVRWALCR